MMLVFFFYVCVCVSTRFWVEEIIDFFKYITMKFFFNWIHFQNIYDRFFYVTAKCDDFMLIKKHRKTHLFYILRKKYFLVTTMWSLFSLEYCSLLLHYLFLFISYDYNQTWSYKRYNITKCTALNISHIYNYHDKF